MRERGDRPAEAVAPPPESPIIPAPIDWWKLDQQERGETLVVLGEWVRKLVRSYALPDQVVPPCWYEHESLVHELLALFQYRNQQQFTDVAPPSAPLDFHQQLNLSVARLRGWVSAAGCSSAEHFPAAPAVWAAPGVAGATWTVRFDEDLQSGYGRSVDYLKTERRE